MAINSPKPWTQEARERAQLEPRWDGGWSQRGGREKPGAGWTATASPSPPQPRDAAQLGDPLGQGAAVWQDSCAPCRRMSLVAVIGVSFLQEVILTLQM